MMVIKGDCCSRSPIAMTTTLFYSFFFIYLIVSLEPVGALDDSNSKYQVDVEIKSERSDNVWTPSRNNCPEAKSDFGDDVQLSITTADNQKFLLSLSRNRNLLSENYAEWHQVGGKLVRYKNEDEQRRHSSSTSTKSSQVSIFFVIFKRRNLLRNLGIVSRKP